MHTFKKGDKVAIFGMTYGGQFIIEGRAIILRACKDIDEQYHVQFLKDGKPSLGEKYDRFVDPSGQADPEGWVRKLNERRVVLSFLGDPDLELR